MKKSADLNLVNWSESEWKDEMTEKPRVDREGHPYMWKEMDAYDRCSALLALHGKADAMGSLADWYIKASRDEKLRRKYKLALEEATKWARLAAAKGNPAAVGFFGSQEPWLKKPANRRKYAWRTVDVIAGVKVLENENGHPWLPDIAGSSRAHVLYDAQGRFLQLIEYDENHMPVRQIAVHPEPLLDPSGRPVAHYHDMCWPYRRGLAKPLSKAMARKYAAWLNVRAGK